MWHSERCSERGQATLEMIGIIPLFMLIVGAIIQLFLIGYAAVAAESSARLAARSVSEGMSPGAAQDAALRDAPGLYDAQVHFSGPDSGEEPAVQAGSVPAGSVSAEATYTVPFLGIGVSGLDLHVTRYAVVPVTD